MVTLLSLFYKPQSQCTIYQITSSFFSSFLFTLKNILVLFIYNIFFLTLFQWFCHILLYSSYILYHQYFFNDFSHFSKNFQYKVSLRKIFNNHRKKLYCSVWCQIYIIKHNIDQPFLIFLPFTIYFILCFYHIIFCYFINPKTPSLYKSNYTKTVSELSYLFYGQLFFCAFFSWCFESFHAQADLLVFAVEVNNLSFDLLSD